MDNEFKYCPNQYKQSSIFCRFRLLVDQFGPLQFGTNQSQLNKSTQSFCAKFWVQVQFTIECPFPSPVKSRDMML